MIEAERAALAAETLHQSLSILEREMTITLNHLNNIATNAALLGGFVFSLIGDVGEDVSPVMEGFYFSCSVLSLGLLMYSVLCSTLGVSLAPTKAFKDREHASMRVAIENLKEDQKKVNIAFNAGVALFAVLVAMKVWIGLHENDWPTFVISLFIIVAVSGITISTMRDMSKKYALPPTMKATSSPGVVSGARFLSMSETVAANATTTTATAK